MPSKPDKENVTTVEKQDTLRENADHHNGINKDQEEKEDKKTEGTSVDREEEETTGETFKDQGTTASPPMHELPKFLDKNRHTNHKSMHYEQ
jgi:hypothetical protein